MDPRLLLKCTLHKFFGYPRGLVDMLVQRLPSPLEAAGRKVQLSYTGYVLMLIMLIMLIMLLMLIILIEL